VSGQIKIIEKNEINLSDLRKVVNKMSHRLKFS